MLAHQKFAHFALEKGCTDLKEWVNAQVQFFKVFNKSPEISQCFNLAAFERYQKYLSLIPQKTEWEKKRDSLIAEIKQ